MRAVVWHAAGDVRLEEVPEPRAPREDEVTVDVAWCGICATDVEEWRDGPHLVPIEPPPLTGRCAPLPAPPLPEADPQRPHAPTRGSTPGSGGLRRSPSRVVRQWYTSPEIGSTSGVAGCRPYRCYGDMRSTPRSSPTA